MADQSWEFLPSLITVEVFSYLPLTDRLSAATTCKRWRSYLFHPLLWKCINFKLKQGVRRRTKFLAETCGKFVREAIVEFDSQTASNIREFYNIVNTLSRNANIKKLAFVPTSCRIEWPERRPVNVQDLLIDALANTLNHATRLEYLALGCIGELADHADSLLSILARRNGQKLQALHIESVKENPDNYGLIELPSKLFAAFSKLQVLGIDYDYLSSELLETFIASNRSVELKQLVLHVHGVDQQQEKIPNHVWYHLAKRNPSLEVTLNLIHSIDGATRLLDILCPAMPLAHIRMFFCGHLNIAAIRFIAHHMNNKLKTLEILDGMSEIWGPTFYDDESDTDPFVMLAWKCRNLSHFTLIGFAIDHDDVVAISRLRGSNLKIFNVPECCILEVIETENNTYTNMGIADENVLNEIATNLGLPNWTPIPDNMLHPAVFDINADAETAYLDILLKDQAW